MAASVLLLSFFVVSTLPASAQQHLADTSRPGDIYSESCGHEGMSVCADACIAVGEQGGGQRPEWCPGPLTSAGCLQGLTRIAVTPGTNFGDVMPDICMVLPKVI